MLAIRTGVRAYMEATLTPAHRGNEVSKMICLLSISLRFGEIRPAKLTNHSARVLKRLRTIPCLVPVPCPELPSRHGSNKNKKLNRDYTD